jgi:hypothetical protein
MAAKISHAVETPNHKHQITNEFQWCKCQTEEKGLSHLRLKLGFIWDLQFGIWNFPAHGGIWFLHH